MRTGIRWVFVVAALLASQLIIPIVASAQPATPAPATSVLVFGNSDNGFERDDLAATLRTLGLQVDDLQTLPAQISGYRSVWDVDAYAGLSAGDQTSLEAYTKAGGSVYLTGERPCCEALNQSDTNILRAVLTNKAVTVGELGDIDGPFSFNGNAEDKVAQAPNLLVDFVPHSPGGVSGLSGVDSPNVLASNDSTPVGGVWDESDMASKTGRIALLMDIDYLGDDARTAIVENLENFLDHGTTCSDSTGVPDFSWTAGPKNCTTLITPGRETWAVRSSHGPVAVSVATNGVTASCVGVTGTTTANDVCDLSGAAASGATLTVTATDASTTVTRRYRVVPQNDPRNVPPPFTLDSDWWSWPDADHDGIPDFWETHGVYVGNTFLDLPGMGANPQHKDLFVHYDYLAGYQPSSDMLNDMTTAFANMPVSNPDHSNGIALHAALGSSVPLSIGGNFDVTPAQIQKVTSYTGFATSAAFGGQGVPQLVKWMFNRSPNGNTIGTAADIPGDFAWTGFDVDKSAAAIQEHGHDADADDFARASNATHELGHLLGLHHHGDKDTPNNDAKYLSVMSYSYSNFGVPTAGSGATRIDYSREQKPHYDYTLGDKPGQIEFVPGQYGEIHDFYARSNDEAIGVPATPQETTTIQQVTQGAAPASVMAYAKAFPAIAATPDIPTLRGFAGAAPTAIAGRPVTIKLSEADPDGKAVSYLVDSAPTLGTTTAVPGGIRYTPHQYASGTETLVVRATNGSLSSNPVALHFRVFGPPSPPLHVMAKAGADAVVGSWTAVPRTGGKPVIGYAVQVSADGGRRWGRATVVHGTARHATLHGVRNGRSYRIRVAAYSAAGTGQYSTPSNSVRPRADPSRVYAAQPVAKHARGTFRLQATLTDAATHRAVGRQTLELLARVGAHGRYAVIARPRTSTHGVATVTVHPKKATHYRWRFVGTGAHAAASSRTVRAAP